MHKSKPKKGLLKRVRITARGKVKFKHAGKSHLNSGLTGAKSRQLRQSAVAKAPDIHRLEKMLHRRLTPGGQ